MRRKKWMKEKTIFLIIFLSSIVLFAFSDLDFISKNISHLGFSIQKINSLKNGYYQILVNRFSSKGVVTHKGLFKPFYIGVKVQSGKLWLQRSNLQKNHFMIHYTKLPKSIILKDFSLPTKKKDSHEYISADDPVVNRMNIYLNVVMQHKRDAPAKIRIIRVQASRADRVVSACNPYPPPGSSAFSSTSFQPPLPRFGADGTPRDILYSYVSSCDDYPGNTQRASQNARIHFEFIEKILKEVNRIKDYVDERCGDGCCINESDKNSLKSTLLSLLQSAENEEERFDRYINAIKRFIEDYKECKRNQHSTGTRTNIYEL